MTVSTRRDGFCWFYFLSIHLQLTNTPPLKLIYSALSASRFPLFPGVEIPRPASDPVHWCSILHDGLSGGRRKNMISEEDIHRYHMIERVHGPPLPTLHNGYLNNEDDEIPKAQKKKSRKTGMSYLHWVGGWAELTISPTARARAREGTNCTFNITLTLFLYFFGSETYRARKRCCDNWKEYRNRLQSGMCKWGRWDWREGCG